MAIHLLSQSTPVYRRCNYFKVLCVATELNSKLCSLILVCANHIHFMYIDSYC